MRTLYHWHFDPNSRQARLALSEKKLKFQLEVITPWDVDDKFRAICLEGLPPALFDIVGGEKVIIVSARAICEYAEDQQAARHPLMPASAIQRAEARRICNWFDHKFMSEVNAYILGERLEKTVSGGGAPDPSILRVGRDNLDFHLKYLSWLLEQRSWIACNKLSLADLSAGAHISCLDYFGEITWEKWPALKDWYQKLKCRPSFQPLLADRLPGVTPPRHYTDLDF